MLKADEIKYIVQDIQTTISSIEHTHYQMIMAEDVEEYQGWTNAWLSKRLKDLYLLICAYLEGREMFQFLETFKAVHGAMIENSYKILDSALIHPEGENELNLIVGFKQFLQPFKAFDYRQTKEDETIKLTSILSNTGFILENAQAQIANEADIYKLVKWILGLYYPTTRRKNKASFIQEIKSYNPDILIPELKTAIEYKYIDKSSDNIDEFLDQLRIDATNYVDDNRYDTFYAVIYIENVAIATPESIEVAWHEKRFPNNWKLVLSGHAIKNN